MIDRSNLQIGTRVRLISPIDERGSYPGANGIYVPAGSTGVIIDADPDPREGDIAALVCLDEHNESLAEWDGCVQVYAEGSGDYGVECWEVA